MSSKERETDSNGRSVTRETEVTISGAAETCVGGESAEWCAAAAPDAMKRAAAKKLIERYFYQLVDGCGDPNCGNEHCASSGKVKNLTRSQAAAQAFQLFSQEAKLCEAHPSKIARTNNVTTASNRSSKTSSGQIISDPSDSSDSASASEPKTSGGNSPETPTPEKAIPFLTEEKLVKLISECKAADSYLMLIRTIGEVYSNADSLSRSFQRGEPESPIELMLEKAGEKDLRNLKKEEVRELEGDLDKDEDCKEEEEEKDNELYGSSSVLQPIKRNITDDISLDLNSLRRAYTSLFQLPIRFFEGPLVNAIVALMENIELELKMSGSASKRRLDDVDLVNIFLLIIELPILGNSEFIDIALPHMCRASAQLPVSCQAKLAKVLAKSCRNRLRPLLDSLQQLITLKIITVFAVVNREFAVQDELTVTAPTKLMKIVYYASLVGGELDPPELRQEDPMSEDPVFGRNAKAPKPKPPVDPLEAELQISVLDCRVPIIPFEDFYNEPLSDTVEMDKDFTNFKSDVGKKFSFMNYPFILTPATKTLGLYYDNRIRMYSERRISFFQSAVGQPTNPYLKVKVRREHLIADALVELEVMAMEYPKDLKKQLVVEFEGEQGIDEGGVSKEFFQLVVEQIFKPDYGMFVQQPDTETVWFNPTSYESDAQFTLIGIVLGLAIYNNVILDVRFPMVLYKKLMGKRGTFDDLQDWNPVLYSGLKSLLEYTEDDIEEAFGVNFKVCYSDMFGNALYHDLKEGGDQLPVTSDNRQEYVDLYTDFLLNKCIERQFLAFRRGFHMVTDESPLSTLFRPEEVEMLVCGSKNFDFKELEEATEYDGGYTAETAIVKQFWELVHSMSMESKRKLLQFATGSDRVPVGGLSRLKLIIAKNGPDSDRLPTAHTCFNVLLLPEYSSPSKLQDRLEKAINYSQGFGML